MTEMRYDGCCQKHIAIMPCEQCAAERQPMTPSNLDLAREVGAFNPGYETARPGELLFTPAQLDAFAQRIRADAMAEYAAMTAKGAKAWADVPDATAWVDELRGSATGDSGAPVQFSPVFEAWAKSLDMDLSRTPEFYGDCNTDYAWLAWQAATANERERCAALADKGFSSCTRIESLFLGLMAEKIRRSDA